MQNPTIRKYLLGDFENVFSVYQCARAGEACFAGVEISRKKFSALIHNEQLYLAVEEKNILGFISIYPSERFIHHFYILPEFQGRGIANQLVSHLRDIFGLPLSLKSLAENTKACGYYESNAWVNEEVGDGPDGQYHHYWLRS